LPSLVYIDLGSNQLKTLHSHLFSGAFSLNTIFLQSNKLTEINTNNAGALFANLTNINILYLNDNRIVTLPNSTFLGLESTLEELDISNNKLAATHQTNSLKTLANLKTLSLNNIDINPLQIAPLTAYAHLERLDLGNNVKLEIDNMTFVNLTNLKSLYLRNVGLKFVDNLHLNEMRRLNVLNLNGNDLDWTRFNRTNRLFQAYLPLTELYLSRTSLCELEILGLDQLNTLGILDLSSNRIEYIRSSVFEFKQVDKYGRGLLTMLNMANNLIQVIEAGSFTYLRGLSFLYLGQNMLNSHNDLDNINFGHLRWLYSLEFSNSNLTHFPLFSEIFPAKISYQLTLLDLSRNKIETLSSSHFQLLQNLVSLDLENNWIGEVQVDDEGLFSTLTKLEILKLSQNRLDNSNLAKVKFANCINLKHLNLSYNRLKSVDNNLFSALKKLETIDLSYNGLIEIEAYSFESMLALKSLYLNDDVSMRGGASVVRLSDRFAHECGALKFVFVSSIEFVEANVGALIGSLKAVEAHKIVNGAVYYSSINIIVDNFDYYGRDERWSCKLTIFMLKAKIHVNLFSDIDFEVFLENCYSLDLFDDELLGI
jgi:Leucine-rich repeat (LRR) protein